MNARQRRKAGRARLRANPDLRARYVAWRLTEKPRAGEGRVAWREEGIALGALCVNCYARIPDPPRYYARRECCGCRQPWIPGEISEERSP